MAKRLPATAKAYIYSAMAQYVPMEEIRKHVSDLAGREIPLQTIHTYKNRPKHAAEIDRLRELYRQDLVKQYPIADILYRLKVRQDLIDDILNGNLWCISEHGADRGNHQAVNQILTAAAEDVDRIMGDGDLGRNNVMSLLFRLRHTDISAFITPQMTEQEEDPDDVE